MTMNARMRPLLASALAAGLLLGACSDTEEPEIGEEVGEIGGEVEEEGAELEEEGGELLEEDE